MGWQRMMSCGVSLAARMPERREVERASPFLREEECRRGRVVRGRERVRNAIAVAVRWVEGFGVVEMMWDLCCGVRCGRCAGVSSFEPEEEL